MIQNAIKRLASSEKTQLSINEIRVIFAIERAIARIEADSKLSKHIIFKGGFVLFKCFNIPRFTRDIDAIGKGLDIEDVKQLIPVALKNDLKDGLWFGDVKVKDLVDQGEYGGIRFNSAFQIDDIPDDQSKISKLSRINIDIGFGDAIPEKLAIQQMPSVLSYIKPISWMVYPVEYIFSEKLQTVIARGSANSRAKDIYDLIFLFERCNKQTDLILAIESTFKNRNTEIPESLSSFVNAIDTSIIQDSWNSIKQHGKDKMKFKEALSDFINVAGHIDQIFRAKK